MRKSHLLGAICALFIATLAPLSANAATTAPESEFIGLTTNVSGVISADHNSDSNVLTFDLFNPSLGTLTGVRFTIYTSASLNTGVEGYFCVGEESGYPCVVEGEADAEFVVSVDFPSLPLFTFYSDLLNPNCGTTYPEDDCYMGEDDQWNGSPSDIFIVPSDGGSLANFIGIGTFDVEADVTLNMYNSNAGFSSINGYADVSWGGELELIYEYEETSPVPLPAGVYLFGSGLLGLIGIARRKKAA